MAKKKSKLEKYKNEIKEYLEIGISIKNIYKLINHKYNLDYSYTAYVHYIKHLL